MNKPRMNTGMFKDELGLSSGHGGALVKEKPAPTNEACRIVIGTYYKNVVSCAAPMQHKDLCYDILKSAAEVIERSPPHAFGSLVMVRMQLVIVMNMNGAVDVGAPIPPKEFALEMIRQGRIAIEKFGEEPASLGTNANGRLNA